VGSALAAREELALHDSVLDPASGSDVSTDLFVAARPARARPRVCVIDDSREFLDLIADVLGTRYEVTRHSVVHDIGTLAAAAPDLLVIDLHCGGPDGGLTGWEILSLARSDASLRDVPALVCSGDLAALREDRIRLVAYGDVQLIAKPFDVQAFEQVVDRMLRLAGRRARVSVEDANYPPLDDAVGAFREGRPLAMCPHGKVAAQGDYCRICG
jgi:CheY-like chemotaxis protein